MKNVYIVLGNGFSLDFTSHIKMQQQIDVINLFKEGEKVPWPVDETKGFLSYKYCPNLWNLGARPYMDADESLTLIEDIITCANMINDQKDIQGTSDQIYLKAYKELVQYFKSLFIYYNDKIDDKSLKRATGKWNWIKYIYKLYNSSEIKNIFIITLNYDIWLERLLKIKNMDFNIAGFETKECKIKIYKPHGSISFQSKKQQDKYAYSIKYNFDMQDDKTDEFDIKYDNLSSLGIYTALIPPAGDSNRMVCKWAQTIKSEIDEALNLCNSDDELIICGVSYWHVDRAEIDHYLGKIKTDVSNVFVFNPNPPRALNAVLTTFFKNVINYTTSINL